MRRNARFNILFFYRYHKCLKNLTKHENTVKTNRSFRKPLRMSLISFLNHRIYYTFMYRTWRITKEKRSAVRKKTKRGS